MEKGKDIMKHDATLSHAHTSSPTKAPGTTMKSSFGHVHDNNRSHSLIVVHQVPDCLLQEILKRLPIKSIFRFKCVSKDWLSLLCDPSFKRLHVAQFKNAPPWTLGFRFVHDHGFIRLPSEYIGINFVTYNHPMLNSSDFPFAFITCSQQQQPQQQLLKMFNVVAPSDELLLFAWRESCYYVCNPFTKQWLALPQTLCNENKGLGFVSKIKDGVTHYKVVLIKGYSHSGSSTFINFSGYDMLHLEVFSSETSKWGNLDVQLPKPIMFETRLFRAVSYNGILHWIDHRLGIIIAYDPYNNTNKGRFIELPKERENTRMNGFNSLLDVCQGSLRYFELGSYILDPQEFQGWSVWLLKDYETAEWCLQHGAKWREICSLDANPEIHAIRRLLTPIAFHPYDMDIMFFWCQGGYIVSFNLRTGCFDAETHQIPNVGFIGWWTVFPILIPPWPTPIYQPSQDTSTEEIGAEPVYQASQDTSVEEMVVKKKVQKGLLKKIFQVFFGLFKEK